jgi:hypothetical protein
LARHVPLIHPSSFIIHHFNAMTPSQLETELRAFASHLLSPLLDEGKSPVVKHQVNQHQQTTITLGLRVPGVELEHVRALCADGGAVTAAWLKQWPDNSRVGDMSGNRPPKSVAIATDNKHVIMDLVFFGLKLDKPDSLTPAE